MWERFLYWATKIDRLINKIYPFHQQLFAAPEDWAFILDYVVEIDDVWILAEISSIK
jgi:hypothetical protein